MQVNGAIRGDFEVHRIRYHGSNKLREAITVLRVRVKREDGAKIWGDDFMAIAFAGLRETADSDEPSWAFEKINKPALVCEVHQVKINGLQLEVQPEITKILMVKGEATVIVPLRMRFDLKTEKIAGKIAFATDATTEIEFDAKQLPVPGSNANASVTSIRTRPGSHGNPEATRV